MNQEKIGDFELYENSTSRYAPKVSIRKNAQIAISVGAVRRYGFRDNVGEVQYEYFLLYYNEKKNKIGLKPQEEPQKGAVKARDHSSGEIQLACKAFFDKFEIPYDETRRFPLEYEEEFDLYTINLNLMSKH